MKKFAIHFSLLFTLTCALNADVLYNPTTIGSSARFSDYGSADSFGFKAFDNFTIATGGTVEKVTWQGFWIDLNNPVPAAAPSPDATGWDIAFYADNAGAPGAELLLQSFGAANVTSAFDGTGVFNIGNSYNVSYYTYSVDLSTAFAAAPATQYWVSVLARSTNYAPSFAVRGATGYDDLSWQHQLGAALSVTATNSVARDRAITLEGTAVPEPSTGLVAGEALLLIPFLRRTGWTTVIKRGNHKTHS